jgi:lactoylglutathione lyase
MNKNILFLILTSSIICCSNISLAQKSTVTLNHIAHYVVSLPISTNFYTKIIGLDTIPEPFHDGKHTWLSIGYKSHLHLIQGATAPSILPKNSHICFTVPSVPAFIDVLVKNNIEYENWVGEKKAVTKRVDGVQQIYFKDPDGYWLEINDAKE